MRSGGPFGLAGSVVSLAVLTLASSASAQDPDPESRTIKPNVLLIVDTSGSMEYQLGTDVVPDCYSTDSTKDKPLADHDRSRWISLVEVLTGKINGYACQRIDRQGSDFSSEYGLPGSAKPPDIDYRTPYHRPISGTCTVGPDPGALPGPGGNAYKFVPPRFHKYDDVATTCTDFSQAPDGLIDSMSTLVRFGLMTFDTLPDPDAGYNSTNYDPDYSGGARGAYSYYFGSPAVGRPDGCLVDQPMEVGVRNGAAPAWEGKLINFGDPLATPTDDTTRHTDIEQVLLSTRPYGATPIAGALKDAYNFLLKDNRPDPLSGTSYHEGDYGPMTDPFVTGGCRDQYVILLTDGEPNLDLRPHCEGSPETCPFPKAARAARDLYTDAKVKTYVVGFAPDTTESNFDCTLMTAADWAPGGQCLNAAEGTKLHACCTLNEIAFEGQTQHAYFSENPDELRAGLSAILGQVIGGGRRSATQPVRSPGVGDAETRDHAVAFRMLTSYEATTGGLWRGNIERVRFVCDNTNTAVEDAKDLNFGDDFVYNVNQNPDDRVYSTFVPAVTPGATPADDIIDASRSLRPVLGTAGEGIDGIGATGGGAMTGGNMTNFVTAVDALALNPDGAEACSTLSDNDCRDLLLKWFVGDDNGTDEHRCATPASCNMIGDVQHSTPVIVDHPSAAIDDETYDAFSLQFEKRPMMVYTSSNDGVFHGFRLSSNDVAANNVTTPDNNEELAFVPPAILPLIDSQYPASRQKLLDGVAVVSDVVATENTDPSAYYAFNLERSATSAGSADTTWRTIMVQSFGGANAGFYALDITEPTVDPTEPTLNGPRLLWQLTTTASGTPLFGQQAATPLITTLNIYDEVEKEGVETAVAILPGGYGSPTGGTTGCTRHQMAPWTTIQSGYDPRAKINCYDYDPDNNGYQTGEDLTYAGARSLTIVRLDNGEIIRTFRYDVAEAPAFGLSATGASRYAGTNGLINLAPLDSPIVGTPAAFPAGLGAVADRVFVGDQDGGLWRVDVSSTDPEDWEMTLFFDAFTKDPNNPGEPDKAARVGQPIVTAPTLSFDEMGQITVLVSTGDQDLAAGSSNYVWSLTERVNGNATGFIAGVNWYLPLDNGEHVLGPIELVGEVAYLSSYEPPVNTACGDFGVSRVYGMHYLDRDGDTGDTGDPSSGGVAALSIAGDADGAAQSKTAQELGLPSGTLIFGVTAEFTPSCYTPPGDAPDTILGGTRRRVENASQATMQLSFQTGTPTTSKSSLGFQSGFETVSLTPPRSASSIESWAAILE